MSTASIVMIIGTRPEGIKMLPVYFALKSAGLPVLLCATMQHDRLLQDVFDAFGVTPDISLDIMRLQQDLFYVTQSLLQKMKEVYTTCSPIAVLVQGDTTSAMAAALAAFYLKIPVGHIEAGLRTCDIYAPFPEEVNRRIIAACATWHFAPTEHAHKRLLAESVRADSVFCVGNTVVDALRLVKQSIAAGTVSVTARVKKIVDACKVTSQQLILLTMHRRESFDGGLGRVLETVYTFLRDHPDVICIYPFHPNPHVVKALHAAKLAQLPNCYIEEPLMYHDLVYVLDAADIVLTDSGGIQEEAISLGKSVLVLREKTEREEGLHIGLAELVGTDAEKLSKGMYRLYNNTSRAQSRCVYGDGFAAERIMHILRSEFQTKKETMSVDVVEPLRLINKRKNNMIKKVSVLGLGYIGLPTAIVCAEAGYIVEGFDVDAHRIDAINNGQPVIQETDLTEKLHIALRSGRFSATTSLQPADYFIIAVPTPFKEDKKADLIHVFDAVHTIATVLKRGDTLILESTVPVQTTDDIARLLQNITGLVVGEDVYVAHCPERVLPGRIFKELIENDRVIGGVTPSSTEIACDFYRSFVTGELIMTDAKTAELVKLIENSSRDVSIAFAHQVASMAYAVGLNPYEVIALANKHPRVNILTPSAGVGGHCIAVDPWFLIESFPLQTELLQVARRINDVRPLEIVEHIFKAVRVWHAEHTRVCTVLLMGLTYKADVDDLRESPALRIADMVKEHAGIRMLACEPHIQAHKAAALYPDAMTTVSQGIELADIVVFLVGHERFKVIDKKALAGKKILDFCGLIPIDEEEKFEEGYQPAQLHSAFTQELV